MRSRLMHYRSGPLMQNHSGVDSSKIESTLRYLGIQVDDAIEIAEKIEI